MPPRPLRRPAAVGRHPALRRRREEEGEDRDGDGVRRRPAAADKRVRGLEEGGVVDAYTLPVGVLNPGLRLLGEGKYWGRDINLAFEVESVQVQGGALEIIALVSGTEDEGFLRWLTAQSRTSVRLHLCPVDCPGTPESDDLVHVKKLQRRSASDPGWVDNLKGASGMEELRRLAERSDAVARAGGGGPAPAPAAEVIPDPGGAEEEKESSESSDSKKKRKRKKKKKKVFKVGGKKDYGALFAGTGLDKDAKTRKKVSRLARRALKRKSRGSSSTDSEGSSGELMEDEMEELFQESARTQLAAKRGPGALAFHAMKQMRKQMLQSMGQEELENVPLQPVGLQFFRQVLSPKMSPVMAREALNVTAALDALIGCQPALCADILVQRLKSLECLSGGSTWQVSQRFEVVPQDLGTLATSAESWAAAKESREELRNKQLQRGQWESTTWKGGKSEVKGKSDAKGKGKTKDKEGKNKGGGDRGRGEKTDK